MYTRLQILLQQATNHCHYQLKPFQKQMNKFKKYEVGCLCVIVPKFSFLTYFTHRSRFFFRRPVNPLLFKPPKSENVCHRLGAQNSQLLERSETNIMVVF